MGQFLMNSERRAFEWLGKAQAGTARKPAVRPYDYGERTDPRDRHQPAAVGIARQDDFSLLRNALAHAAERQVFLEHQTEHRYRSAVWSHRKCDRTLCCSVDPGKQVRANVT
jgi:hypothetical protein